MDWSRMFNLAVGMEDGCKMGKSKNKLEGAKVCQGVLESSEPFVAHLDTHTYMCLYT